MPERYRRPQLLAGLIWEEVSGVDEPANLLPGWLVRKSKSRRIAADRPLLDMDVVEKVAAKQYTFGVVYAASTADALVADAHGEAILEEELQKAAWDYVKTGDRRVYAQHGEQGIIPLGEWVDLVSWPYEVTTKLTVPGQKAQQVTVPKNSVFMGVLWNSMGWDLVRSGQIKGLSLGGRVRRKTAEEIRRMTTPLEAEFEAFIANLKARMPTAKFDSLMKLLAVLTAEAKDLDNPAGAGLKGRVIPSREQLTQLIEDCRVLELDDDLVVHIIRFMTGTPEEQTFGESGLDESDAKAVKSTGLGEVITKLVAHAYRQGGKPLVPDLNARLHKGLDEEEA